MSRLCFRDACAQLPEQAPRYSMLCLTHGFQRFQRLHVLSHVQRPASHVARLGCHSASPAMVAARRQAAARDASQTLRLFCSSSGPNATAAKSRNLNTAMYMVCSADTILNGKVMLNEPKSYIKPATTALVKTSKIGTHDRLCAGSDYRRDAGLHIFLCPFVPDILCSHRVWRDCCGRGNS